MKKEKGILSSYDSLDIDEVIITIEKTFHIKFDERDFEEVKTYGEFEKLVLDKIQGIEVIKDALDINMVFFKITDERLEAQLTEGNFFKNGIKINPAEGGLMRFVCHYYINKSDIDKVLGVINEMRRY